MNFRINAMTVMTAILLAFASQAAAQFTAGPHELWDQHYVLSGYALDSKGALAVEGAYAFHEHMHVFGAANADVWDMLDAYRDPKTVVSGGLGGHTDIGQKTRVFGRAGFRVSTRARSLIGIDPETDEGPDRDTGYVVTAGAMMRLSDNDVRLGIRFEHRAGRRSAYGALRVTDNFTEITGSWAATDDLTMTAALVGRGTYSLFRVDYLVTENLALFAGVDLDLFFGSVAGGIRMTL